ncbi:hypothetical protein PMIN07_004363 [Paraphaeosphaeria minitans]
MISERSLHRTQRLARSPANRAYKPNIQHGLVRVDMGDPIEAASTSLYAHRSSRRLQIADFPASKVSFHKHPKMRREVRVELSHKHYPLQQRQLYETRREKAKQVFQIPRTSNSNTSCGELAMNLAIVYIHSKVRHDDLPVNEHPDSACLTFAMVPANR